MAFFFDSSNSVQSRFKKNRGFDSRVVSVPDPSTDFIVTLAEAKNYIRVLNNQDDTLITNMITQAVTMAETYIASDIVAKVREQYLELISEPFNLIYAPIASVDSVEIRDAVQVLNDGYQVNGLDNPEIQLGNTYVEKVKVTYTTAGRTDAGIKQGILCNIAYLYHGRYAKVNTNYKPFLAPYKVFGFYGIS